jgi:eukaryotic-like serine/threonine-protein kinase
MSPERWEQITEIYARALELGSNERIEFLEKACAQDEALRREVESLLAADAEAGDFIAEPIVKNALPFAAPESAPSLIGKKLGHYQIISRLGTGGMGEVYLAKDTRLNRPVALKTLPISLAADANYLHRFQIEAEAAATLNHPNVATVYSVEEIENQPVITMEYVKGQTLDRLIPAGGLDVKTFLEWFIPVTDALAHAHEKGVVHRDIKPGNIMITADGAPKVLDFGLAQIERETVSDHVSTLKMTQPGQIIGTPSYMSPEQAEGKEIDARTDIFSLGVVMYEAVAGQRPFVGDSYASIVSNLLKTDPPPISEIKPETPYLLARLINRCLNKQRRHRFQSMREIRVLLEEIQAAVLAGVSMDSFAKRLLPKQPERRWRARHFAMLAFFVAAASIFAFYYFRSDASPPIRFENMTLRKFAQTNNVSFVQIMPDGKSIVYFTLDEDSTRSLWIQRIEDKSALRLLSKELRQFWGGIGIAPDGSQIFYILADENARYGTLYRISSLGGTPRKLVENANDVGSVSADGQRILFARHGERIQILSANTADGGDERLIHTGKTNEFFRDPQFSADGKSIFFSKRVINSGKTSWSLVEIPAEGGAERTILTTNSERIGELAVLKNGKGVLINKSDDASKLQQLFYVSLPDGKQQRITNDLNTYHGIGVSADGNTIVATQNSTAKDIWIAGKDGENLRQLTAESNVYTNAVFTPDGRIVYDALDNNRPDIWIMNADGGNRQQLTPGGAFNLEPQVSPDGRFIVFTSDRTGENKIWRMNIDGSNPVLLTNVAGGAFAPVISPDSQTVWFQWSRDNKQVSAKVPLAGGEVSEQQPSFGDNLWAISPDGKQLASVFFDTADNQFKVRVRPLDAEEPSKVFDIAATHLLKWTADGKNLLYRSLEPNPAMLSIVWLQPLSGGAPKQFLSVKPDRVFNLSQSADGKQTLIIRTKISTSAVMLTVNKSN